MEGALISYEEILNENYHSINQGSLVSLDHKTIGC